MRRPIIVILASFGGLGATASCSNHFSECEWSSTCQDDAGVGTGGSDGGTTSDGGSGGEETGSGGGANTTGNGGMDAGGMTGAGGLDAGTAGTGGMGGACDDTLSPGDEPCLVSDEFAVFVSPDGDDDGDGGKASPVATFAQAIEMAFSGGLVVIACSGEYNENVVIDAAARVYGSFDCDDDWVYAPNKPTIIAPSERGYALHIDGVDDPVVIEDIELVAQDGVDAGESSIAGFVSESSDVTLRRVVLEAGDGVAGDTATNPGFSSQFLTVLDLQGVDGAPTAGGVKAACECPDGATTTGGKGGGLSEDGAPGLPDHPGNGGEGGVAAQSCSGNPPGAGIDGAAGPSPDDAPGASTLGTLTADGFAPSSGAAGAHGLPGQGGGGGAGKTAGGGGSGGCGGCGGHGGPGGQGGGASIALLVFESTLSVEASELIAGNAGNGGSGAAGEAGQAEFGGTSGGIGGNGAVDACDGGNGGIGGKGASGGGGAGGVSAAIVWSGSGEPSVDDDTTIAVGDAGTGGDGGTPGDNDGVDGEAADVIEITQ